jgi:hypothetical protein
MCWNAPVSLATFITSIIMCLYLWSRNLHNDRILSIWIFWFALMQLFEFFMWRDMKNHSLVSKLAFINILIQPFALTALLFFFYRKEKIFYTLLEKFILFGIMGISLIKSIAGIFYAFITHKNNNWLSTKGPHCHLIWWFSKNDEKIPSIARVNGFYIAPLLLACALIKPFNQGLIYFLLGLMSFLITKMFYSNESGSLWCWIANLMGLIAIGMPYLKL